MSAAFTQIRNETAYDAMQDGLALVVRLLSRPATVDELLAVQPEVPAGTVRKRLERLERCELVRRSGERYEAVAKMVQQTRQEGMITSLSRYVLPLFADLAREPGRGFVQQIDLALPLDTQRGLRTSLVQDLLEDLNVLSEESAEETLPCIAVVVGTSDVPPASSDPGERLIETVRRSARQRATNSAADRAVMTQVDGYFGIDAIPKAERLVRTAAERLAGEFDGSKVNYSLVLAFSARKSAGVVE